MPEPVLYPDLSRRVVIVTGGASGIGASIVRAFAAQGSRVAFLDVDEDSARALVAALADGPTEAPLFLPCDLRDVPAMQAALAEARERIGPAEVLINNAASDDRHALADVSADYWDERMALNLRPQFFAAQAVRADMAAAGGGAIVNMGSIAWRLGLPGLTHYGTAKAAITGLTKGLAREFGSERIRVNCIEPGLVMTDRQKRLWVTPDFEREVLERQCLPDLCQPEDVASLVVFLASDQSRMISGQTVVIDGGWV